MQFEWLEDSATELCLNNAYVTPYYTGPPGPTTTPGTASTTPQTGTTQCGNPSQEDYDFPCHPYLIYRDIVLLVDVIPTPSETTKTSQLQSFLANFTEHLLPSQAYSQPITRLALGSYDKNGLRTTNMRFSTDQTDWQKQISDVMADAGNPNIGGQNLYAALDKALDSFQYQLQFRDHTDAMIIIVTDHMSADNSSQASYTDPTKDIAEKLKGDGFWIAAIAPTFKGGIYTQLQSIVTNPNDVSVRNGISYCPEWALLTSACVSFAKTQACQYLYPNTATLPPTTPYTGPTTPYVSTSTTTGATTVTTTQAPNAETHCQVLDILFVLDESESITEPHFRQITNFTARIAELYTFCGSVNPDVTDCTKMAAIKFGDYAEPIITFNQAYSSKFFSETVTNTGYDLGKTNTDDALHLAETFFTNPSYGSRPNVQRVIVLITDGHHSEGTTDPKAQASNLRIQEGVTIISIGVNGTNGGYSPIDTEELNNIT
uniref:VWFA domain-containing protein n=1 Tax=Plectus sambesii TaxID=2011161 RepID=A0A914XBC2_9BILA